MRNYVSSSSAARSTAARFLTAAGAVLLAVVAPLRAQQPVSRDSLAKGLAALRGSTTGLALPAADAFTFGESTVAAGATAKGPVAVAGGTLHVRGTVDGDAVTYRGDIVVHQGGVVSGNATAILGKVSLDGGRVDGDTRAIAGNLAAVSAAGAAVETRTPRRVVIESFALAAGWLAVLAVIGIGVLVFVPTNFDAVSDALERDFGRSFLAGIAGQIAFLPVLVVLCVGLGLTLIGILLIPFAIVAYILAAIGLVTLGYLAVARLTGRAFIDPAAPGDDSERRAATLKALMLGLAIAMSPWFIASLLSWSPAGSLVAHTVAWAVTWVACTAGLGAAIVSRGGVRRLAAPAAQRAMNTASWQTPTPVSGVAAARRPTPATTPVVK